jgi:hypothetical protein
VKIQKEKAACGAQPSNLKIDLAIHQTPCDTRSRFEGIACGDGSDGCITTDSETISIVKRAIEESELWHKLTEAEPKKADILLNFHNSRPPLTGALRV